MQHGDKKKLITALSYALGRDLKQDKFVFKRTVRALIQQIENFELDNNTLNGLESLLIDEEIFIGEFIEEYLLAYKLETLFEETSQYSKVYVENLNQGKTLLEVIRNKKGGPKASVDS